MKEKEQWEREKEMASNFDKAHKKMKMQKKKKYQRTKTTNAEKERMECKPCFVYCTRTNTVNGLQNYLIPESNLFWKHLTNLLQRKINQLWHAYCQEVMDKITKQRATYRRIVL